MALRDAIVAAEELVPALRQGGGLKLAAALPEIERRRQPELRRIQALQAAESSSGELLRSQGWLRQVEFLTRRTHPQKLTEVALPIFLGRV
jgi:2-polyprenyl-6-methoxyphenol hydroxylase-like FAD-dependent oxidoreductase